jgi:hypothetical protein
MTAISADADQCYDRINHIVLALALRAVCGDANIAKAMLKSIQHMKYYQRTGRGDSNTFLSSIEELLQGICQGNTAGPACWIILSSIMIRCYMKAGRGSKIISPISSSIITFMGEIFVDDTDLLNMLTEELEITDLMELTQGNLDAWARLLMGTGGSLKPPKCYWYLISYINKNGMWDYDDSIQYSLTIPLPDGSRRSIEQLPTGESRKMLGVWSNPRGNDDKHIHEVILEKTKSFVNRIKNCHLPTHLVWKAYRSCLIPALKYGLSTLATETTSTQNILRKWEFNLLSYPCPYAVPHAIILTNSPPYRNWIDVVHIIRCNKVCELGGRFFAFHTIAPVLTFTRRVPRSRPSHVGCCSDQRRRR